MTDSARSAASRDWRGEHVHFVTGRLAEFSLRKIVTELSASIGFEYSIDVLNITVAALMTPDWIARRISVDPKATIVLLPGYCEGDLQAVEHLAGRPVERGPRDLRRLEQFFGREPDAADYGNYDIEILAEINHAPTLLIDEIVLQAKQLAADGADLIDVGCDPGTTWPRVGDAVRALRDEGLRVSIDSMNPAEIEKAVDAGAELVLSVNSSNRDAATDWGCEVVAIPDDPASLAGLDETVEFLADAGVPLRIDPILAPIGLGFADSLNGYFKTRAKYPDAEMMMGIGNLTELTDVDSAGVNVALLGMCQELGIRSVLTTQVINWARTSVRECDLARRLVYHAVTHQVLPKHVEPSLVMLRDTEVPEYGEGFINHFAAEVKDNNFRIFVEHGQLHLITGGLHVRGTDPFGMIQQVIDDDGDNLDRGHAFYLGFEMAKALTALTLSKDYRQDEALDWGFLTAAEDTHQRVRDRTDS